MHQSLTPREVEKSAGIELINSRARLAPSAQLPKAAAALPDTPARAMLDALCAAIVDRAL